MLETIMWDSFQDQDNILSIKTPPTACFTPVWFHKNDVGNAFSHIIMQMILSICQLMHRPSHTHVVILFLCDWQVGPGILSMAVSPPPCSRFLS